MKLIDKLFTFGSVIAAIATAFSAPPKIGP